LLSEFYVGIIFYVTPVHHNQNSHKD
jgi:hypothetical protein